MRGLLSKMAERFFKPDRPVGYQVPYSHAPAEKMNRAACEFCLR
jgi:hypothetical protein